ncbi:PREDICTED: divergent paired-related homeobox [Chinchilla lanigera]|uniref:divergent paired-related homeobox n=1 Tax=Chinchilla lanigera TaxID=34839 RepID=UPI0006962F93|nr:PREDICTED: divergent paired-related homeobox [Chinchilla lanigera]
MNMHPTVLQVWFKNQRAKLKKANNHAHHILKKPPPLPPLGKLTKVETETQTETEREAETEAKAKATERRSPPDAYPVALVYTGHALPSYQLTICPDHLHPGGHKLVHFGCCQDPLVYCMHPVPGAHGAPAPALPSLAPHGHREATQPSGGQGPLQAHTGDCPAAEAPLDSGAGEP